MIKNLNKTTVERAERPVRILQFGEGNFLRAFADWAIDVANEKGVIDAGVAICKPRARANGSKQVIDTLREQDNMFHVCLEGVENMEPKRELRLHSRAHPELLHIRIPGGYREMTGSEV